MKIKLSRNWKKCFAWWPMYVTKGFRNVGSIVWLEFVYRQWTEDPGQIDTITVADFDDREKMIAERKANPKRFGDEWHHIG